MEPRSSKKALDYVDVVLAPSSASALHPPTPTSTTRIASSLKEKSKGKDRSKSAPLSVTIALPDGTSPVEIPVTITYLVSGGKEPVSVAGVIRVPSACQLVPTVIDAESYRALMVSAGGGFTTAVGAVPLPAGSDVPTTISSVVSILRAHAVARSPQHAILYARTAAGANVTALLKVAADGGSLGFTVKSEVPAHAAALMDDVLKALAAAAAAAAGSSGKDEE